MNNPLISVIVPCYKQAQYLDECLQSVFAQRYQNWECIIVNDGSPDETESIAKYWLGKDSRFKYLYKENGGLSSARNAGIEVASGEWVQFLDCDDLLEVNKLEHVSLFFGMDVDVLISGYRYFYTEEGISKLRIYGNQFFLPEVFISKEDKVDLKVLFRKKNPFVVSAPLYRRRIFDMIGLFDLRLKALEDWEFNLRCAFHDFTFHHVGYAESSKVLIRIHKNSMMQNTKLMQDNLLLFNDVVNQNVKVLDYFGITSSDLKRKPNKYYVRTKELIKLFIPPIFLRILLKK